MLRRPARATHVGPQDGAAEVHVSLRLHEPNVRRADVTADDAGVTVSSPALEMPNVGEVVQDPPADVVTCALVLLPWIPEADDDFHRPLLDLATGKKTGERAEHGVKSYDSSPPSSSPSFVLRMSSGSAAASTTGTPATGVSEARGADTVQTVASGSSRTSTPAGMFNSRT